MMQSKAFLLHLLAEHRVDVAPDYIPRWYYWPNCRPLDGLPVTVTVTRLAARAKAGEDS